MNTTYITEIEAGLRTAFSSISQEWGSVGSIKKQLLKDLKLLSDARFSLSGKEEFFGWEKWLIDNYYSIDGHGKQALKDLSGFKKSDDIYPFYRMIQEVFSNGQIPIQQENVFQMASLSRQFIELSEDQLSFIYTGLKLSVIHAAAKACTAGYTQEEKQQLIRFGVIGLSQLYEINFEQITSGCSKTEEIFSKDPSGIYPNMAQESRRYYRQITARLAKKRNCLESQVAQEMLTLANGGSQQRTRHVGYYLLQADPLKKRAKKRGLFVIWGSMGFPILFCFFLWLATRSIVTALLCYLPFLEIIRILLINFTMRGVPINHLPRMELSKEPGKIPKTVIAVSTLLPNASHADELESRLEQLYFSNQDENLYFCVLADFKEDKQPYNPQDNRNVQASREVISELNQKYGDHFMLFIRKRSFNKTQNSYCGWERKRGAITEFIRFIKGKTTSVRCFEGSRQALENLKYIIALDADTNLSFQSANILVSAAAHPLNQPVIGSENIVVEGYGILVPRMGTELTSIKATDFTRVMAGCGGVSTYEQECCDFYQDMFGEAIFSGKGLIDIDAFYQVLDQRFPENIVLSHDILEGAYLRTGYISDVEMTDKMPTNVLSWFTRLHRWLRGDWQNILFLKKKYRVQGKTYENPINLLSRYKLLENLRRSMVPVIAVLCVIYPSFTDLYSGLFLCAAAFFSVTLNPLISAYYAAISAGDLSFTRRFFVRTMPRTLELLGQGVFSLIMCAQQMTVTLDAVGRTLWRVYVSQKGLLQWTTSAQGEIAQVTVGAVLRRSWPGELLGLVLFLFSPNLLVKLFGILFLSYIVLAVTTSKPTPVIASLPDRYQRERILSYCARMFRYYEDFADEENHFLPPDNVQLSPVDRIATRTSPTNIGMMLLSYLAARDFHFINSKGLYQRIKRTLDTIAQLEKYEGHLYNWYDTHDLRVLPQEFISTVDSGNYLCALVALKEGLREYTVQEPRLWECINEIETILEKSDLSIFYNPNRKLFSIGIDSHTKEKIGSYYDFLMSEARTTSYYAIAKRQVEYKHWRSMNRTMSRAGSYAGPVSWTGTMFEYFMPHLLLPIYEGSLLSEALQYCVYCQKKRVHHKDIPWGISESGYFAFDEHLNYQYKAHGIQRIGVKQGLDKECVISPYSTFLTLPLKLDEGIKNLEKLENLGMLGYYGFYEGIDFTPQRIGKNEYAVIRSYMAHHIGMSMIACANSLFDNVMQKRFMRDHYMKSAREFLQEQISKDVVVYDQMKPEGQEKIKQQPPNANVIFSQEAPGNPKCTFLSNGNLTHLFTDNGSSFLRYGENDVTRRPNDLLTKGQGIFSIVKLAGELVPAAPAPFYLPGVEYRCEYGPEHVSYSGKKGNAQVTQTFSIDQSLGCERCTVAIQNHSAIKGMADVLFYLEPVLSKFENYAAHPAFSKLFVLGEYDSFTDTFTFLRRHKDGSNGLFFTVGFLEHYTFEYELKRDNITPYPEGMNNLLNFESMAMSGGNATPDGCCALRLTTLVPAGGEKTITLLLSVSPSKEESVGNIVTLRQQKDNPPRQNSLSPLASDTMEARIGSSILGQLLFSFSDSKDITHYLSKNTKGQDSLWPMGISGDIPIVVYDWAAQPDEQCLSAYIRLLKMLRMHKLEFDLCVMYDSSISSHAQADLEELLSQTQSQPLIGLRGGIFLVDIEAAPKESIVLLKACACHIAGASEPGIAASHFAPMTVLKSHPIPIPAAEDRFDLVGGAFANGRFYVERVTPLPFSHILANPTFGTLMSDTNLGNTWWANAREFKITPWYNDIATGNDGERLYLKIEGAVYDLISGSRASFSPQDALYEGNIDGIASKVRVTMEERANIKYIDVSLTNTTEKESEVMCAYYTEPVLGVTRKTAKFIQPKIVDDCLVLHNPYNTALPGYAAFHVPGERPVFTVDRASFLSGNWSASEMLPNNDPCTGLIISKKLPPHRKEKIRFILTAADTREAAVSMAINDPSPKVEMEKSIIQISTPDIPLNRYINLFAPHQILAGRIYGRTAFYQCSGAYGFRDQLQDVSAYMLLDPQVCKTQILRCCSVQFEQGDVLHWWHELPGVTRGVRTTFSDDLVWLPYVVCEYVKHTGDESILDLEVRYIKGDLLSENEEEKYMEVQQTENKGTVFEHCVKAIERAYRLGDKGIPLIGCGDWNDGFSNVGVKGQGQSVWLGMFLAQVMEMFSQLCEKRGDSYKSSVYRGNAKVLKENIDKNCWDGAWYQRAFYDDGTPIGSAKSPEASIDILVQSFSAISQMPQKDRINTALTSAWDRLVDEKNRIIKLFSSPFENSEQNPGYIKAYPPGIRENGGQYTHAAVWFALSMLKTGRLEEGWTLLDMINPVSRCTDGELARKFKIEPYYMPADIYTNEGAYGHGGWNIYTGAASWYYRTVIEDLLGLHFCGSHMNLTPLIPKSWRRFTVYVKRKDCELDIEVVRTGTPALFVDGKAAAVIPLDGKKHEVLLNL
ncbi:GH36-type glycosyl hydrolase domain-containing protein [Youxingia wuxianensis]|uniref:Uncharacterized protein n=1 Tax=Youxingia wuxianensis TaxID=2763678 RepID=A0A926EMK7_9FIRM|nr:glucoamylase family protein [Youxingia wuxianensis]MBC8585125.1 hypothetical protein [Youxingia wuxianensis]